jgi:hypothetical protein
MTGVTEEAKLCAEEINHKNIKIMEMMFNLLFIVNSIIVGATCEQPGRTTGR